MRHCPVLRRGIGVAFALLVAAAAWAQAPVGTISGTVRDQSDAVIPQATITIRNIATGVERHLLSAADGTFSASSLAAGDYTVIAELQGSVRRRPTSPSPPAEW
jgi:hypothetical protein